MKYKNSFAIVITALIFSMATGRVFHSINATVTLSPDAFSVSTEFKQPCEIIDFAVIHDLFVVPESDIIVDNSTTTYPTCKYTWKGDNMKLMGYGTTKNEVGIESKVTIVLVDKEISKSGYDAAMKSYTDELEELSIGDYGIWSNKRKQMTVLVGKHLFHVHVDVVADNVGNKNKTIALSEIVISKL